MNRLSSRILNANILAVAALLSAPSAHAQTKFTAKVALEKLPDAERTTYILGIVEGMAFARGRKDTLAAGKPDYKGAACIRNWLNTSPQGKRMVVHIDANFVRYPDYTPAEIIATMVKKQCGE